MSDEVLVEETDIVSSGDAPVDDLDIGANLEDLEEYLKGGYPSDESDGVSEETEAEATEEVVSQAEVSEDDGYYTMEELLAISPDDIVDDKFDSSKVKPGSPVEKFVKGFERAYTKKFTKVSEKDKEVMQMKAEIEALKNRKSFDPDEFLNKQREFEEEKRQLEAEELLTDEEREQNRRDREYQKKLDDIASKSDQTESELQKLRIDASNSRLEAMIAKAGAKHSVDVDAEDVRIQREIGWVWDNDKANGRQLTPVDTIMEQIAINIKNEGKPVLTEDFWDTPEGKKMIEQKLKDEVERVKKMKQSGGKVAPSSPRTVTQTEIVEDGVDFSNLSDQSLEHYLATGEVL